MRNDILYSVCRKVLLKKPISEQKNAHSAKNQWAICPEVEMPIVVIVATKTPAANDILDDR